MTCKRCGLNHSGMVRCEVFAKAGVTASLVTSNQSVTKPEPCNQCVTKATEIARLQGLIDAMQKPKSNGAKRNRAEYMRKYRAKA